MKINILFKTILFGFLFCGINAYSQSLEDIVPVEEGKQTVDLGFGIVQNKEKTTASTMTITADDLKQTGAINLQDALYGRLLGLTALKQGGFSGDNNYGGAFNIRGIQTTSENYVLILVDGLERPIDRLTIEEVESVTVLKDAAATALYGYRGINGAVLVKTKRGNNIGRVITASYDHKITFKPELPEFVNAYTYAQSLNEARANDGMTPYFNPYELDAYKTNKYPSIYPNVNWADETLKDTGSENIFNLSVTGGGNKVKYYTMLNYITSDGLLAGTDIKQSDRIYSSQLRYAKMNLRTNIDFQLTSSTQMQVSLLGMLYETNRPYGINANGLFSLLYAVPGALFPVKTEAGIWGGTAALGNSNPVAQIQGSGYTRNFSSSINADVKLIQDLSAITEGLSASARIGYDNYSLFFENRSLGIQYGYDRYTFDANGAVTGTTQFIAGDKTNTMAFSNGLGDSWRRSNIILTGDYKKAFDVHNLAASVIFTSEVYSTLGRYNTFYRNNWSGYVHYDYNDKYLADLALVVSGSNRSYPEKFAFSPVLSVGWVASNENALKDNEVIDFLKVRASAGILHTDYVPRTAISREDYNGATGNYYFGNGYSEVWGAKRDYQATKHFNLETSNKFNFGVDLTLLKNINITAEAYYQRRNNILMSENGINSDVVGIASGYKTQGVVDSKGIEALINYSKTAGDWKINATAMVTYGSNKVIDRIEPPTAYSYLELKGKPVDVVFGLETLGFFKDEQDIANSPKQEFNMVRPGDIKYKDQNGDGVINDNDLIAIGYSPNFPELNYSFSAGLEYKGIGFNALFQGADRYTQFLNVSGVYLPVYSNLNLSTHYYENRWIPGQDNANAKYPRLATEGNLNNFRNNDIWLVNAAFLKLRNVEVYYKLPHSLLGNSVVKNVKIYAKGENLLTIDDIKVMDPEAISTVYPTNMGISLGFSASF
ncbi:SusC/RagA family TonB-linked outer membrane protein [Bacteroidia bacterium]|nr:SusC/RagA family TonB-linked outer membrane protein [Bacteroidia bacterium]